MKDHHVEVSIEATVYDKNSLFLRQHVGEATAPDGSKLELATTPNMAPQIRLPDGRWVVFSWNALLDAALKAGEQEKGS